MKLVIGGSRRLPKGQAPRLLVHLLAALPEDAHVMVRKGVSTPVSRFEADVVNLCEILGVDWGYWTPQPSERSPGRVSVYVRDMDMINASDLVILFFTPEDAAEGYSGTYHLLDKALDVGRPVHAYSVDDQGRVERVGDYDPLHLFDHLALDVARNAT